MSGQIGVIHEVGEGSWEHEFYPINESDQNKITKEDEDKNKKSE